VASIANRLDCVAPKRLTGATALSAIGLLLP